MSFLASRSSKLILPEEAGVYRPRVVLNGLALNLLFWHPELKGATFYSRNPNPVLCAVTGTVWGIQGRTADGDDIITVPDYAALDITGSITIEVVFKTSSAVAGRLLSKRLAAGGSGYALSIGDAAAGKIRFLTDGFSALDFYDDSTNTYHDGAWHHCFAMLDADAGTRTIEVDGTVDGSSSGLTGAMVANNDALCIFADPDPDNYGSHQIGEIRIYNRALTGSERQRSRLAAQWRYT